MRGFVAANVDEDLRHFLKDVRILIPVEFDYVLADVIEFTSSVISEGLPKALAEALAGEPEQVDRPYVDICDALAERHVRSVPEPQRSVAKKSLFETYVYFGGPQHVFETADKTRLYQTLRRRQQCALPRSLRPMRCNR